MMSMVWESKLEPEQKYTMLALLYLAEDDGCTIYCKRSKIAETTGLSERTISRHLRVLKRMGWVSIIEDARHHSPPIYRIVKPKAKHGL